jgi:hypothetical protein
MALTPAPTQDAPYWKKLLGWGVCIEVLSGVFTVIAANQATDDFGQSSDSGGLIFFAVLIGGVGAVLLIPGMIGWGIDAAGLAVRVAPLAVGCQQRQHPTGSARAAHRAHVHPLLPHLRRRGQRHEHPLLEVPQVVVAACQPEVTNTQDSKSSTLSRLPRRGVDGDA